MPQTPEESIPAVPPQSTHSPQTTHGPISPVEPIVRFPAPLNICNCDHGMGLDEPWWRVTFKILTPPGLSRPTKATHISGCPMHRESNDASCITRSKSKTKRLLMLFHKVNVHSAKVEGQMGFVTDFQKKNTAACRYPRTGSNHRPQG